MKKKLKIMLLVTLCICLIGGVTGCAVLDDTINEIKGNLVGNGYTIRTYDNYGSKVMTTTGDKINIQGNPVKTTSYSSDGSVVTGYEMSSVITINIDGKEIQSCGDTCIFEVDHIKKEFGDLLWFIAEYCTAKGWSLDDIMRMNIDKLKERYPDGFKAEQSLHRKAGDI